MSELVVFRALAPESPRTRVMNFPWRLGYSNDSAPSAPAIGVGGSLSSQGCENQRITGFAPASVTRKTIRLPSGIHTGRLLFPSRVSCLRFPVARA